MSVAVAILGLAFLILIHEAGHFFVARLVGMNPRKFYLGFPPAVAKARRNGIEYGIGAIPLGGYVKIPGMFRPGAQDVDRYLGPLQKDAPGVVPDAAALGGLLEAERWREAGEALDALERRTATLRLDEPVRGAAERGFQELRDALSRDAYWRAAKWKRIAVIFAGPGVNLLLAVVLFAALLMVPSPPRLGFQVRATGDVTTTRVAAVVAGEPAKQAGLRPGDRVVAVGGRAVSSFDEMQRLIRGSVGHPVRLTVERDGRRVTLAPATPRPEPGEGFGTAVADSVKLTGQVTKEIFVSLGNIVHERGRKDVSSALGTVHASSEAVKQGWRAYLWVLGLISLSLALLNLLPLLPLDGGHILFSVLEGIRGRAVAREVYERVSAIGIALVLLLFFVGLTNDVGRLGG